MASPGGINRWHRSNWNLENCKMSAKSRTVGLWIEPAPIAPWEFRLKHKQVAKDVTIPYFRLCPALDDQFQFQSESLLILNISKTLIVSMESKEIECSFCKSSAGWFSPASSCLSSSIRFTAG